MRRIPMVLVLATAAGLLGIPDGLLSEERPPLVAVRREHERRQAEAASAATGDYLHAVQDYLARSPKAPDREAGFVLLAELAEEVGDHALTLRTTDAYHKEFPEGDQRPVVLRHELSAACTSPQHVERALRVLAALESGAEPRRPDAHARGLVAMALAQAGHTQDAEELLIDVLISEGVRGNERLRGMVMDRLAQIRTQGEVVKPFRLQTVNGREVSLEALRGKVVLLDFWATWCGPCRAEIPALVKLYERLRNRGFEIVGVSLDMETAGLSAFVETYAMGWPVVADGTGWDTEMAKRYKVESIPDTMLIDREGRLVRRGLRGEELAHAVEALLASEPRAGLQPDLAPGARECER